MLGVSLVTADDWILRHYASSGVGDITRLTFAKRLFAVPIAVLGQATGQASLPFFARLFNREEVERIRRDGKRFGIPGSGGFVAGQRMDDGGGASLDRSGVPAGKVSLRGHADQRDLFFLVLAFPGVVVAQGLYARAFYAAGDTLTPMVAVSAITVASLPVYSICFIPSGWWDWLGRRCWDWFEFAGAGLPAALAETGSSGWDAMGRVREAALTAAAAGGISFEVAKVVPLATSGHGKPRDRPYALALVSLTWAAAVAGGLWLLRSELPRDCGGARERFIRR